MKTTRNGLYILPPETEITKDLVVKFIEDHKTKKQKYIENDKMYIGEHEILEKEKKADYKPDNRLVINYAKYIVDVMNGYFIGVPIKETYPGEDDKENVIDDFVQDFIKRNDLQDNEAEISKMCSKFGHGFELLYQNTDGGTGATYLDPIDSFMVYDDTVEQLPLFFVTYYDDDNDKLQGTVYTKADNCTLSDFDTKITHPFGDVPAIEYIENEERQGAFDNVKTLINELNKAMSEKANDVDYFADAYLKILGAELDEETLTKLRDSRIINLTGDDISKIIVEFLAKPSADETQENLINRLIDLIYQIAMIANVTDETFSNASSGTALEFKLQPMKNLAQNKERKFQASLKRRWEMVFRVGAIKNLVPADAWSNIEYKFTRNIPQNLEAEVKILRDLEGVVSKETQFGVTTIVLSPREEMKRMVEEQKQRIAALSSE